MKFPNFRFPFVESSAQPWWVKVKTQAPTCTYYFGPFDSKEEASRSKAGYMNDLAQEGAQSITANIERTHPQKLTICDL